MASLKRRASIAGANPEGYSNSSSGALRQVECERRNSLIAEAAVPAKSRTSFINKSISGKEKFMKKTKQHIAMLVATLAIAMLAVAAQAQTTGTPGKIAKFKSSTTLGDSVITEDKFGKVGIGTDTPTSKLTVTGTIESTSGGVKFPDGTVQTTAGVAPNDVVRSLNGLKGDVQLAAGSNITITPAGNTITVAAPNTLTAVAHDATLTGSGTAASPLSVVSTDATLEPFAQSITCFVPEGQQLQDCAITTVPTGKRLVIEYLAAGLSIEIGKIMLPPRLYVGSTPYSLVAVTISSGTGFIFFAVAQQTRIYADQDKTVSFQLARRPPFSGLFSSEVTISGHLVDLP
jgi:hypothetical protein